MPRPVTLDVVRRGAFVGAVAVSATLGVAAAIASGVSVRFARRVVTPPKRRDEPIAVRAVTDYTVTLSSTADTRLPGEYGLFFAGGRGHARVGTILSSDERGVTRELLGVGSGDLAIATRARWSGWVNQHPRELGVDWSDVVVPTDLGNAPAWLIPSPDGSSDWAIHVHGRGARRGECLRAVPTFRDAGWTSLVVSYRNDGEAPASADGRYGLGVPESRDVESAIRFALRNGATRIVLMGWSMGGATVLQTAMSRTRSAAVVGLVLDSPVTDWASTVDYHGRLLRLTPAVRWGAKWILRSAASRIVTGLDSPIDFEALDAVSRAHDLTVPVLMMHSKHDGYVPFAPAAELARARPDLIDFEVFTRARHAKLWNYDPERWTEAIRRWLDGRPAVGIADPGPLTGPR